MAYAKVIATMSNCISTRFMIMPAGSVWIYRDFVSATRPSQKVSFNLFILILEMFESVCAYLN